MNSYHKKIYGLVKELRELGCAVVVLTPDELNNLEPEILEEELIQKAWSIVDNYIMEEV